MREGLQPGPGASSGLELVGGAFRPRRRPDQLEAFVRELELRHGFFTTESRQATAVRKVRPPLFEHVAVPPSEGEGRGELSGHVVVGCENRHRTAYHQRREGKGIALGAYLKEREQPVRLLDLAGQRACLNQIWEHGPVSDTEQTPPFEFLVGALELSGGGEPTTVPELEKSEGVLCLQHHYVDSKSGCRTPHEFDAGQARAFQAGDGIDLRQRGLHLRFSEGTGGGGHEVQHRRTQGIRLGELTSPHAQDHTDSVHPRQRHERSFVPALFARRGPDDLGVGQLVGDDQGVEDRCRQGGGDSLLRRHGESTDQRHVRSTIDQ